MNYAEDLARNIMYMRPRLRHAMMRLFGKKVDVRVYYMEDDTDFSVIGGFVKTDDGDDAVKLLQKHGTVIYAAGLFDDDPDRLMCLGKEDGSEEYRIAFHGGFKAFCENYDINRGAGSFEEQFAKFREEHPDGV